MLDPIKLSDLLEYTQGYEIEKLCFNDEQEQWYVTTKPEFALRQYVSGQFDSLGKMDGQVAIQFTMREDDPEWAAFFEKYLEGFINVDTANLRQLRAIVSKRKEWDFMGMLMYSDDVSILLPAGEDWYDLLEKIEEKYYVQLANLRSSLYSHLDPVPAMAKDRDSYNIRGTTIYVSLLRRIGQEFPVRKKDGRILLGYVNTDGNEMTEFYSEKELLILLSELGFN